MELADNDELEAALAAEVARQEDEERWLLEEFGTSTNTRPANQHAAWRAAVASRAPARAAASQRAEKSIASLLTGFS